MPDDLQSNTTSNFEDKLQDTELVLKDVSNELDEILELERKLNERKALAYEQQRKAQREKWELQEAQRKEQERIEREERIKKEAEQAVEFRVSDFNGFYVTLTMIPLPSRTDVNGILNNVYGRRYDSFTDKVQIPADSWPPLKEQLLSLPNIKVTHLLGMTERLKAYYQGPEFEITLMDKYLKVQYHQRARQEVVACIPGTLFNNSQRNYQVPITEGWRLFAALEDYKRDGEPKSIVWDPRALELVQSEIERRAKLDAIATRSDSEIVVALAGGNDLRPFQKVGVEFIDTAKGRAFLADQMGLGKTWQAIAYAVLRGHRVVVICPAHLKANWSREITKLTGTPPTVLWGREPDPFAIQTLLINKPKFVVINYDIVGAKTAVPEEVTKDEAGDEHVVPAHDRFLWAELLNMSKPDLIVLDEAHYIKNTSANRSKACRSLQSDHRLPMTGTPILNRPGEFWASLNWVRPDLFPSEERFVSQYTNGGKGCRNTAELRELLKSIMIRRVKSDVVSELPAINRITRLHELSPDGREEYKRVLEGVYRAIDEAGNNVERNVTSILVQIGKLKEVCAHDKVDAVADLATELYDTELDASDSKLGNKKVLIFSQYKDVVRKIARRLGEEAIYWTGDTSFEERTRLEHEFQNNPKVHFLVVSLMTGQTGLNLTAAGHIIFADLYWTPAAHAQAEERAYGRLSDLHGADSYYLVAEDTIEDWIQEMLLAKLLVINAVVEGIDAERDNSIALAIIGKLKAARGL